MIILRFFFVILLLLTPLLNASEVKIIELHKNKSLDQLVLESENPDEVKQEDVIDISSNDESAVSSEVLEEQQLNDTNDELIESDNSTNNNNQIVSIVKSESIFDLDEIIISNHLESIKNIKSKILHREFIKILSNPNLENLDINNRKFYYIIKKLYDIGEIGIAYNLIKTINLNNITNQEDLKYFYLIELNYLFSTFKLVEVCDLKLSLLEKSIDLPKYLLEKTDIFCLTLENKIAEAKLLNSLLLETEKQTDQNFQKLFNFMILNEKDINNFETLNTIKSKELIFLYSAMLRINELALDEDFIGIDPLNLSIPLILSNSSKMDIRIKAANKAFYDGVISIESLSALYQSADFNSKDFNKPDQTIIDLDNNIEMIMAFYYQLANIQIFPDQRLNVILDYWNFAADSGLEKIAYAITKNIIDVYSPTSENTRFAMEIAFAHISNQNYIEASKWINLFENTDDSVEVKQYAKFLIALNETNELDTIKDYLKNNYDNFSKVNDQKILETLSVLINFLNIEEFPKLNSSYNNIFDERPMPSYFLISDINENIKNEKNLSILILSLLSLNNKNWSELHPEHLYVILKAFNKYEQGYLVKSIILEILNELEIF